MKPMMATGGGMGNMDMHMADITSERQFLTEMIPHHQEAVDTAKLTLETTQNEELRGLLKNIVSAQESEIGTMGDWLDDWYPGERAPSQYKPMMGDLTRYGGEDRDVAFLQGMIMHHHMAIVMAEQALAIEPRQEVRELAEGIIATQTAEIADMRGMLKREYDCGEGCHMMNGHVMRMG
jgi:uncharacterized protein (DUF305 family)